jgi:regulator of replication initiation timing
MRFSAANKFGNTAAQTARQLREMDQKRHSEEVDRLTAEINRLKLENETLRHHLSPPVDLIGCDICKVVLTQDQITRSPAGVNILCPTCATTQHGAD